MAKRIPLDKVGPQSFSDGVDKVALHIRPHGRANTAFPAGLKENDTRRRCGESLHAWLVRLVNKYCNGDPRLVGIEENIALLANFQWEKDRLKYASIPIIITECTLEEYCYSYDKNNAIYFRLDLDDDTLGTPFSHPLPHIHSGFGDSPRFSLDGGTTGNVIMDFLEFIYRNHAAAKWLHWARREWLSQDLLPKTVIEKRAIQFDQIVEAFRESEFNVLRANARVIAQIKKRLRESKDSFFRSHMDGADREILEYPIAR